MKMAYKTPNGMYTPTRETYPLMDALAMAVAVDRMQGFIKANQGFTDPDTQIRVHDNRTVALNNLRRDRVGAEKQDVVQVTETDQATAKEIFDYFDQVLLLDKLSDNLVKSGKDGSVNDYNQNLAAIFDRGVVDTNKELSMIVSLPNSRRVAATRETMDEFYRARRFNGYVGEVGTRIKIKGRVMDVKFLPKFGIHLVAMVTSSDQIVKFFLNDKLAGLAKTILNTDVTVTGTVKKQDVNNQTECQETVINRVKFGV
jgi:hypothetical protein